MPDPKKAKGPSTRRRVYAVQKLATEYSQWNKPTGPNGASVQGNKNGPLAFKVSGTQVTTSEGHPFFSSREVGKGDVGGNFFTQKKYFLPIGTQKVSYGWTSVLDAPAWKYCRYTGPILPVDPNTVVYPPDMASSNNSLNAIGTTAIARVKPTNPVAGLTAALTELHREGLPHVMGSTTWRDGAHAAQSAGDEYLNYQFGYVPLANDIASFASTVVNAHDVIERYKQGIGKTVRRSYDFPSISTLVSSTLTPNKHPWFNTSVGSSNMYGDSRGKSAPGVLVTERRIVQHRWFRGAFTYFFPETFLSGKLRDYAILAKQIGLEPSPAVLWQITPWSWAIDWFSNAGDVISNWSSFHQDGLVMLWGYQMEHTIVTDTYSLIGARFNDGSPISVQDLSLVTETKIRRGASPYGFGLNYGNLSGFQQSILAALGLSKMRL